MKEGTCVQIGCRGVRRTRTDIEQKFNVAFVNLQIRLSVQKKN